MTLDEAKQRTRTRWGRVTPYRLGRVIGLAGLDMPPPYDGEHSATHFLDGVEDGKREAKAIADSARKRAE